ncbi:MAG TPA: aquaporin [Chthoniobacterales bacterium]
MWKALQKHWPEYFCEAALVALFVLADCLFTVFLKYGGSPFAPLVTPSYLRRLCLGLALGGATVALVLSPLGRISGAHMNPAITLTFLLLRKIKPFDAAWYVIGQTAGVVLALVLLAVTIPKPIMDPAVNYAVSTPGPAGELAAFAGEFGIAFVLMFIVLWVNNTPFLARLTPWFAACLVVLFVLVESPLSGATMDPAFATVADAFGHVWTGWWLYVASPLLGMPLAAWAYSRTRRSVYCAKLFHYSSHRCIFNCQFPALLAREAAERGREL